MLLLLCLYSSSQIPKHCELGGVQVSPIETLVVPKIAAYKKQRNSPLHHASCLVRWLVFACVCVCFSHLVYVLVPNELHPLEAFVVSQFGVYKKKEFPFTQLFLLGEVGGCLCVFVAVSPTCFLGWCQASPTHWKHWWSPSLRGKQKRNSPFTPIAHIL